MSDLLDAALAYADRGWAVLPLYGVHEDRCACGRSDCKPAKHPVGKLVPTGLKDASTDKQTITQWWEACPRANVGIATGAPSGLIVLDIDPRNGGPDNLARLVAEHGDLPPTIATLTGGGGYHMLYAAPSGGLRCKDLAPGVELKADGGYIVVPPSRHITGGVYRWHNGSLDWPSDRPLPLPPDWLVDLARGKARATAAPIPERILEGQRNTTLTSLAGSMQRRAMTTEAIEAALLAENVARCDPPLAEAEVRQIAASLTRYPPTQADDVHRTDMGNAVRLVALYGEDLLYCWPWGCWLAWDSLRWRPDDAGAVHGLAKETVRSMYAQAAAIADEAERKRAAQWAIASETRSRVENMVALARSEPGVPIVPEALDVDSWALNVANGTLDLRTGELRRHRREDFLTKLAPVVYDPDAVCPRWLAFLERVMDGNAELIAFLQRAIGYSLTGDVREHVLCILYGVGANGKSTFLSAILHVLGDYGQVAAPGLLLGRHEDRHPTEVADLRGARFVAALEVGEGRRLAEELVKHLTGGDMLKARRMREDFWEFTPTHKLFLACNYRPEVRGTDIAIWRRIRLIPFDVVIPPAERDKGLSEKLKTEASGILAWAVAGCLAWQREGLKEPKDVVRATTAYRKESDVLGDFLGDRCILELDAVITAAGLYRAYTAWAEANGERPLSQTALGLRLKERGLQAGKDHRGTRFWEGLTVKTL